MGLFSSRDVEAKVFSERDLDFNKAELQKSIVKSSEELYAYRNDESHLLFANYLRDILNLEILQLSEGKLDQEHFAYQRGRIDALRHALNLREKFILDKKILRETKNKSPDAQESKRSYVRSPSTQAGLSI